MEHCTKPGLERKLRKHGKLRAQQPQVDFIARSAHGLLRAQLNNYIQSGKRRDVRSISKGLLLYEQSPALLLTLPEEVEFDQIPFSAALLQANPLNALYLENYYQILLSNLAFDWLDASEFIQLIQRMLAPQGHCWFTAYGEQTATHSASLLTELDNYPHFNAFYNLQDIGDAFLGNGFKEVVVESNIYKLEYGSADIMISDAKNVFGLNIHPERRKGLSSPRVYSAFCKRVEQIIQAEGKFVETVEIMLAHVKMPEINNDIPVTVT